MKRLRMLTVLLAVMVLFVGCGEKPLCTSVTVEGVRSNVRDYEAKMWISVDDAFYQMEGASAFAAAWRFDEWELCDAKPTSKDLAISFCFAELYIVELYHNGQAAVYYGYAPDGEQWCAYYTIPTAVVADVKAYLDEHAQPCDVGGANASTFIPHYVW